MSEDCILDAPGAQGREHESPLGVKVRRGTGVTEAMHGSRAHLKRWAARDSWEIHGPRGDWRAPFCPSCPLELARIGPLAAATSAGLHLSSLAVGSFLGSCRSRLHLQLLLEVAPPSCSVPFCHVIAGQVQPHLHPPLARPSASSISSQSTLNPNQVTNRSSRYFYIHSRGADASTAHAYHPTLAKPRSPARVRSTTPKPELHV